MTDTDDAMLVQESLIADSARGLADGVGDRWSVVDTDAMRASCAVDLVCF